MNRSNLFYLFGVFIGFAASTAKGQSIPFNNLIVQQLDQRMGLSETSNALFFEDDVNNLWISSVDGLNRFNGSNTVVYRPGLDSKGKKYDNIITSRVFVDKYHNYWYSTRDAIHTIHCDLTTTYSSHLRSPNGSNELQEIQIVHLEKNKNRIWVNTSSGLFTIDLSNLKAPPKFIHQFLKESQRYFVVNSSKGELEKIVATSLGGNVFHIVLFEKGKVKKILPIKARDDHNVFNIYVEKDSIAWVACSDGLYKYDIQNLRFLSNEPYAPNLGQGKSPMFTDLIPYGERFFWIISYNKGLFLFDKLNPQKPFIQHYSSVLLNGEKINLDRLDKIFGGKDGIIWLANWERGLMYFNPALTKSNAIVLESEMKNQTRENVTSLHVRNRNQLYFTVLGCGLFEAVFQQNNWNLRLVNDDEIVFGKKIISSWGNELLIIDNRSLFTFNTNNGSVRKIFSLPTEKENFKDAHLFDDRTLVVQTPDELFTIDLQSLKINPLGLPNLQNINTIHKAGKDLLIINYVTDSLIVGKIELGKFSLLTQVSGVGRVNHLVASKNQGILWMASSIGLIRLIMHPKPKIEYIGEQNSELKQAFNSVLEDNSGHLWLASNSGVLRLIAKEQNLYVNRLNEMDGVIGHQFNPACAAHFNHRLLFFGGPDGVQCLEPEKINFYDKIPRISLQSIVVNGDNFINNFCSQVDFLFRCHQRNIAFQFNTSDFVGLKENEFQYRLYKPGFSKEDYKWINIGNSGNINLASLNKGDYTLEVIVCNSDGIWMKKQSATQIQFHIQPYWYETTWFYLLLLVAFIVATYLVYRNRLRRIQQKATLIETELKVLRLQMNPHFIYNCLSAIQSYVVRQNVDKANSLIVSFSKLMRKILKESVKPYLSLSEEKELLESYLRTESLRFENKFNFQVDIDSTLDADEVFIPTMILQPFVENAIVHGFAKNVNSSQINISFKPKGNMLECIVRDNGAGLGNSPGNEKHQSQALEITQKRLQLISKSASMQLINLADQSPEDHGVMVILLLPLDLKPD